MVIKYGNSGFYFSVRYLVTVELGTIHYQGCKSVLFLAPDCANFTDVLVSFYVTHGCMILCCYKEL